MAPFVADDGVLYLGEKTSEYYLVDARTGLRDKVYTSPSANALKNSNDPSGTKSREGHVWEGGGGGQEERGGGESWGGLGGRGGPKILLGRQNYRVTALDSNTGMRP
jgi:hypothetical protein